MGGGGVLVRHVLGGLVETWRQWETACCWLTCCSVWSDSGRSGTCSAAARVSEDRLCDCSIRLVVCWRCRWLHDHARVSKAIVIEPLAVLQGRCRCCRRCFSVYALRLLNDQFDQNRWFDCEADDIFCDDWVVKLMRRNESEVDEIE